jgi:hypothetical protein
MGTVLGGKVAAPSGRWAVGLGRILATGPGWWQSKGPARMRCSDAGRPLAWHQWGWWGFGQPEAVSVAVKGSWSALLGGSNWSVRMSVHSACPTPLESTVMPL